jgi:hypothetical protein
MSTAAVYKQAQDTLSNAVGAYEEELQQRILNIVGRNPRLTKSALKNRLGFVLDTAFELALDDLTRDGKIVVAPSKYVVTPAQ